MNTWCPGESSSLLDQSSKSSYKPFGQHSLCSHVKSPKPRYRFGPLGGLFSYIHWGCATMTTYSCSKQGATEFIFQRQILLLNQYPHFRKKGLFPLNP